MGDSRNVRFHLFKVEEFAINHPAGQVILSYYPSRTGKAGASRETANVKITDENNRQPNGTPKKKSTKSKTNKRTKKTKSEEIQTSNKRSCRICGCTDDNACVDEETGETCTWVEDDLCSNCEPMAVKKSA